MKDIKQLKILIAEDHVYMRKIIKTILVGLGYRNITEAADGAEAIQILETYNNDLRECADRIELVICDWVMPRATGLDVLRAVRGNQNMAHLPFLMLTSEADNEAVQSALESGVSDYLVKPFTAEVLEKKLRFIFNSLEEEN